jgi:hypothetical protein
VNYYVPSWGNLLSVQPQNFAEPAPDTIAPHRSAQRLLDAPAEPAEIQAIGAKKSGELAARSSSTLAIYGIVFSATHQSAGAGKIKLRFIRRA